jgi:hypothetical protein
MDCDSPKETRPLEKDEKSLVESPDDKGASLERKDSFKRKDSIKNLVRQGSFIQMLLAQDSHAAE